MNAWDRVEQAVSCIRQREYMVPQIGVVLGSGLGAFAEEIEDAREISFREIPGFPVATVSGHNGAFVFGTYHGIPIVVLRGRVHCYEGYEPQEVAMPVRVMAGLGVKTVILTNAAGGVNISFEPGTLMMITDHINFAGMNPLRGANQDDYGPRFPDMSDVYNRELRERLMARAEKEEIPLREGIYLMYGGPSFETPAEIRAFRILGADAVGMSTVPEAIAANHCGVKVIGISCITNMAAGILPQKLTHEEVLETSERVKPYFLRLLRAAIEEAGAAEEE